MAITLQLWAPVFSPLGLALECAKGLELIVPATNCPSGSCTRVLALAPTSPLKGTEGKSGRLIGAQQVAAGKSTWPLGPLVCHPWWELCPGLRMAPGASPVTVATLLA